MVPEEDVVAPSVFVTGHLVILELEVNLVKLRLVEPRDLLMHLVVGSEDGVIELDKVDGVVLGVVVGVGVVDSVVDGVVVC